MTRTQTALGSFEIENLALGYQIFAKITQTLPLEVLEATIISAKRYLILVNGSLADLKLAYEKIQDSVDGFGPAAVLDHEIIECPHTDLLPAYYSLAQEEMQESLIVIQTDSVSSLLSVGDFLLRSHSLKIIEMKILKGSGDAAIGFFTGSQSECLVAGEEVRSKLKSTMRAGRVEVIEEASESFRRYFNLSGVVG